RLGEAFAALLLVDAEAFELDPAEAAADAEDEASVGEMIEHDDLLGDTHRVVPGKYDHHRAKLDPVGAPGEVGQVLQHIRAHRVFREVVLDAPQRFEGERLGEIPEPQLVAVDVAVRAPLAGALKDHSHSDVHDFSSLSFAVLLAFRPRSRASSNVSPARARGATRGRVVTAARSPSDARSGWGAPRPMRSPEPRASNRKDSERGTPLRPALRGSTDRERR